MMIFLGQNINDLLGPWVKCDQTEITSSIVSEN